MEKAIIVKNITKKYKFYDNTKERLFDLISPRSYGENFYALANVTFEADKGEVIGFVGVNGSGKSTLSNIISGIVPETTGSVKVNGHVSLIAVAAGLKNDLTGRDNIELKLLMLGFSKEEINDLEQDIIEFSELGRFIDQPVKSYSSGMKSRLGFAISVNVDPDILIIDEALSVGDKAFAEKSLKKMQEFKERGKTMIFVSHSIGQMQKFCDKILWLEYGMIKEYGSVQDILPRYDAFLNKWRKMSKGQREKYRRNALEYQRTVVEKEIDVNLPETWLDDDAVIEDEYREYLVSRVGQIKSSDSILYSHPLNKEHTTLAKPHMNRMFYIKKRGNLNEEPFYLLSEKKSYTRGIIGWIRARDVQSYLHLEIDNDEKIFYIKGTGYSYRKPWGGKKHLIHKSLKSYKDDIFTVFKTEKIGKNIWYQGELEGESVWIHCSHFNEYSE